ncbi:histidine kinase N-terminal 7TM domain-containing protein [Halobacterium bonnevillei]|uniref:histidine kinase n=1 Tax=Halobacterium bonnevillei TaxID=2692200 RepID=A0A6B0SPR9_9EURY|nr:histidine kinase N-terminal 7TM domain-containing protein [Halobacterium bonnevillei]MXR22456.1 PAS domain-containing protein [Halobacterium bonnevillei]
MQFTAAVGLSIVSTIVSAIVAVYAHRRSVPGSRGVAAFSSATAVWAGGNAVQVAVTDLPTKLLAINVQYVGILVVPLAWFVFAAEYTGRESWVTSRTVGALAVFPVVLFVAAVTNEWHMLVRTDVGLETADGVVRLTREFGPLFWVATAYSWLVSSVGTMLLLEHAIRVGSEYRRQTVAVLAGVSVPWLAQTAYFAGATSVEPEAFFGVTAAAFGYAIVRHDLLDLVPIARDRVFEELRDGVVVVDGEGRIADYNPAAASVLGTDLATGERATAVLPDAVLKEAASDEAATVEVEGDDDTRWLAVESNPVSGAGVGELLLLRDVTELHRRREELDRENDRLERVADTISHDLRNPLNVADGYLDIAERTGDPEEFDRVRDALDRMDNIIDGTLRMARVDLQTPEKTDISLTEVAERAWLNIVTNDATLDIDSRDVTVRADPDQLESLLENVFRNAVEHGGEDVTVTVGVTSDRQGLTGFYVADDGPGIPKADREEVFKRGFTTSSDGTGLGLSIVADIADVHDWSVDLTESAAGGVRLEVTGVKAHVERAAEP